MSINNKQLFNHRARKVVSQHIGPGEQSRCPPHNDTTCESRFVKVIFVNILVLYKLIMFFDLCPIIAIFVKNVIQIQYFGSNSFS